VTQRVEPFGRERIEATLAERARAFARPALEPAASPSLEVVAFGSGDARYAIAAEFVQRIERIGRITRLPGAPAHFAGVTNIHGQLLPLIDLRRLLADSPTENAAYVVVLGKVRADIGVVAETVLEIHTLPRDSLADGISVLDGAALLDDPRLTAGEATRPGARRGRGR
jgi:chemotaxis signal transduction protein